MTLHLQHVDGEYKLVLTREQVETLHLAEGAAMEWVPVENGDLAPAHRQMTVEEGMDIYLKTEHLHLKTYQELAK